jgi:hypothetical protein
MAGITGMATTFNCPNFVGELFAITPTETPFLSAIGGLTGGVPTTSTEFQWQGYDLRDPSQRTRLEGADAPDADTRVRSNVTNVVEIHQESVNVSYTKQAAFGQYGGINIAGTNPVQNEIAFQIQAQLQSVARDVEYSFIQGAYQLPADNTTPRRTRGILAAIATNVVAAGAAELTSEMVLNLLQNIFTNGGIGSEPTILVNAFQKRKLTQVFITEANYQESTRSVGGVSVQTIETDFGVLNIMLNRYMPADQLAVVSLTEVEPVFLYTPSKGFLFVEPLAKTGASDKFQLYGEIGLKYGNERKHGKITGLATAPVVPEEES